MKSSGRHERMEPGERISGSSNTRTLGDRRRLDRDNKRESINMGRSIFYIIGVVVVVVVILSLLGVV
ncbi:hypothetical protein [Indioceanicola profundi]|uniref:hypothetical protein n=1 Tax=Indioceanicola profundi TaxID=2220096 RepID=UPI0013C48958|nr:hypothetical protein [Indioceanicola profundi]